MNTNDKFVETPAERSQVGVTPVQVFTSPAIPVLPGAPLEPRLGRPVRNGAKQTDVSTEATKKESAVINGAADAENAVPPSSPPKSNEV